MSHEQKSFASLDPLGVAAPVPPYSHVTVSGDLVAVSGQMPIDVGGRFLVDAEFEEQAHQVLRNIELCLAAAECRFADVFKVNSYLADLSFIDIYNAVYRTYFSPPYPARTTVQAALIGENTLLEVDVLAQPIGLMIVDWQTHWFPEACLNALLARKGGYPRVERSAEGRYLIESAPGRFMSFEGDLRTAFTDFDEQLAVADENGIDLLVSSLDGFGEVWDMEATEAAEWLDLIHEELARNQRAHPDRFRGLAMLPMHHPETAVEVLDRAIGHHGLRGVCILATVDGASIATDALLPVYTRIAEHGVPMWLHPSPRSNTSSQFLGKRVEGGLGWMFHTAAAALGLIDNGTLDRCPGLTVVHPHLGGMLPYVVGRLERIGSDVELSLGEYLRTRFYTDTVSLTPGALSIAIDTYGIDRILFATDYPFEDMARLKNFVELTCPAEHLDAILHQNALPGFVS